MDNRNPTTLVDLTLRARYLRSATLARMFRSAVSRIRGMAGGDPHASGHGRVALERR